LCMSIPMNNFVSTAFCKGIILVFNREQILS